jgi:hypothetical protein
MGRNSKRRRDAKQSARPPHPAVADPTAVRADLQRQRTETLVDAGSDLLARLVEWRDAAAQDRFTPQPFLVLPYSTLVEIAAVQPRTTGDLAAVTGIGPARLARWGDAILGVVAAAQPYRVPARLAELVDAGYLPAEAQAIDVRIAAAARHYAPKHLAFARRQGDDPRVPAWAMRAAAATGRRAYATLVRIVPSDTHRAEQMRICVDEALAFATEICHHRWLLDRPDAADVCGWLVAAQCVAWYSTDADRLIGFDDPAGYATRRQLAWGLIHHLAGEVCLPPLRAGFTGAEIDRAGVISQLVGALVTSTLTLPDQLPPDAEEVTWILWRLSTSMLSALTAAEPTDPLRIALAAAAVLVEASAAHDAEHGYEWDEAGNAVYRCRPTCQRPNCDPRAQSPDPWQEPSVPPDQLRLAAG